MNELTQRQRKIAEFIASKERAKISDILDYLKTKEIEVSRFSIIRDLERLISAGIIKREGRGRGIHYTEKILSTVERYIDVDEYFNLPPDKRPIVSEHFDSSIFKKLKNIFSTNEKKKINQLNAIYLDHRNKISKTIEKKELERLIIELSWKSSEIEGNTYTLLDTELLIKENIEAKGHPKEEAIMILNHKKALQYVWNNKERFKKLSLRDIEDVHKLIVSGLGVSYGLRRSPVGITGTAYKPLGNIFQIEEAARQMTKVVNAENYPPAKALVLLALLSYIQPFEDGNKRSARLLANAILLAYGYAPISYRSVDEKEYKKAVLLFYEKHNINYLKKIFVGQFIFAVNNYFA